MEESTSNQGEQFIVLVNEEEQYSLWPKHKQIPNGWKFTGQEGSKEECCRYIDSVWTDMRPASLRASMDQQVNEGR